MSDKSEVDKLRSLLVLSLVTLGFAVFFSYQQMPVAEELLPVLDLRGAGAIMDADTSHYVWLAWLVLYLCAHALALLGAWFSRHVFLLSLALWILMPALSGLSMGTPWDNTAWSVHTVVSMFAIGMLFFAPGVRRQLRRDQAVFENVRS